MATDGLSDHELLMEVRGDVKWIKNHLSLTVTRREFYGSLATIITIGIAAIAVIS